MPSPSALTTPRVEARLRELGFGYRAKYLHQTAVMISRHPTGWLDSLRNPESPLLGQTSKHAGDWHAEGGREGYVAAHAELLALQGVGPKVADCVCLMGLGWREAVPVDTHVWQIAQRDYKFGRGKHRSLTKATYDAVGDHFRQLWGKEAGWAHSVLFTADLRAFAEQREPLVAVAASATKQESSDHEVDADSKDGLRPIHVKQELGETLQEGYRSRFLNDNHVKQRESTEPASTVIKQESPASMIGMRARGSTSVKPESRNGIIVPSIEEEERKPKLEQGLDAQRSSVKPHRTSTAGPALTNGEAILKNEEAKTEVPDDVEGHELKLKVDSTLSNSLSRASNQQDTKVKRKSRSPAATDDEEPSSSHAGPSKRPKRDTDGDSKPASTTAGERKRTARTARTSKVESSAAEHLSGSVPTSSASSASGLPEAGRRRSMRLAEPAAAGPRRASGRSRK